MKKLSIFTVKSYIGPFVLTFFIALFVLLMQFLWKYIDDFVGKGFEWNVIAELMFYASATFVPMALPLAVLLSSLMTFGNLGEYYELVAIKSAGISLQRLMRPLIVFIIMVSMSAFYFSNYVLPKANLEFFALLRDVRQKKPAVTISEGVFNSEIGSFVIKVGKKYPDGIRIEDIVIYDHSKKSGNNSVTVARSGRMEMTDDKKYLILTLKDGINYDENTTDKLTENNLPMQITRFSKEVQRIDLSAFEFKKSDRNIMRNSYQMLNVHQLIYYEDSLLRKQDSVLYSFGDFSMKDIGYYNMFYKEDTVIVSGEVDPYSVIYKPDTSMENRIANTEHLVDEVPKLDSKYKFDSEKALLPDFIQNFDSTTQVLVASSALTLARMSAYQSTTTKNRISSLEKLIIKFKVEWHRKYTLSVACIILFFIGAPLGAIIRKGGLGMPLVISIIMFVLYHVLTIIGEKAAKSQILEPWFGMWLASMIYFPLGVFITYKATTDAPLLDSEAWQRAFARINIFSKLMNSKNATRK